MNKTYSPCHVSRRCVAILITCLEKMSCVYVHVGVEGNHGGYSKTRNCVDVSTITLHFDL